MIPKFLANGNLPPGLHEASWEQFLARFAHTPYRKELANGLHIAIEHLREAGCPRVYIDGSFVTRKRVPGDYDCCWEITGVNMSQLKYRHPVLLNFSMGRLLQKATYKGEPFPSTWPATSGGTPYLDYFQRDKNGKRKGIIVLNSGEIP